MRDHDDSPGFIGVRKQARLDGRSRFRFTAGDRVHHRLCLFLRSRAGARWADVLPDLDERLRTCGLDRAHALDVRRRLIATLTRSGGCGARVGGGILNVVDGMLVFEPINRKRRRLVVPYPVERGDAGPVRIR